MSDMDRMAHSDSEDFTRRTLSPPFLRFCLYTYATPNVYTEPLSAFAHDLWDLARTTGLPVSVSRNMTPRETFLDERAWNRFRTQVQQGKVRCCRMRQYPEEGMTMHSFLPLDRPLPLGLEVEFVPEGGVSKDECRGPFELSVLRAISRYPTNLSLELDPTAFPPLTFADVISRIQRLEAELVTRADAACACVEKRVSIFSGGRLRSPPTFYEDTSLIDNLDTRIPAVFWGMFLGPKHIERLGGKDPIRDALSDCRVNDVSTETGERLYIQLTEKIEDFDEDVAERYRPLFEPLLRKE